MTGGTSHDAPGVSCSHGCEDGWVYDWETNRAWSCSCRVPAARARKQQAEAARHYRRSRQGGKASAAARARRRPSRARRRSHAPCEKGASRWFVRDIGRAEFEARYRDMCAKEGLPFSRRGLNTAWALYDVERRSWHAQGQDFETTNGQRQVALAARDRGRCRRTVQYTRKRLGLMGVVAYFHIRRGGAKPGEKDTLLVRMLRTRSRRRANCTPPFGEAGNQLLRRSGSPASNDVSPPQAADGVVPDPPPVPVGGIPTDEERHGAGTGGPELIAPPPAPPGELIAPLPELSEAELQARFDAMKRQAGWRISDGPGRKARVALRQLRRRPAREPDEHA